MGVIMYHSYGILIAPRVNLPSGHDHIEKTKWACIGPRQRYKYGEGTQGCTVLTFNWNIFVKFGTFVLPGVTLGYHINFILHTESRFQGSKVQPLGSNLCTTASWPVTMDRAHGTTRKIHQKLFIVPSRRSAREVHLQTLISPLKFDRNPAIILRLI
jgi:hypothetical protein